jgi:hypothetical protein
MYTPVLLLTSWQQDVVVSLDDASITARIKVAIINDPLLNVSKIDVVTADGVVQLNTVFYLNEFYIGIFTPKNDDIGHKNR